MEFESGRQQLSLFDKYFAYMHKRKPSDRTLLVLVIVVFLAASAYTLLAFNESQKSTVATAGGTLVEGIVGTPRFANPVLAITRTDQDIVSLLYSGLMKLSPDGTLEPDLAESVTVSDDGLVYNVVLRDDINFHDDRPLTAEDVAFTVGLIQDPTLKSPLRGNWNDVTVEVLGEHELNFVLEEAYTPFIENLTVGILPKHIWGDLSTEQLPFSDHNTDPIGSGPYMLDEFSLNQSGLIESYTLQAFPRGEETANIHEIVLRFYQNEESLLAAFREGQFMSTAAFSYETLPLIDTDAYTVIEEPLPRVFSIFFNQNKSPALREEAVREALAAVVDRHDLVNRVLNGYGVPTDSPVPPGFLSVESQNASSSEELSQTATSGLRYAESLLIDAGWEQNDEGAWVKEIDDAPTTLSVTLSTANSVIFEETTAYIQQAWESLGVEVNIALFEQSDLVQASIRPRDYQALLFGAEIGRPLDFYPFWHSSQKDDPGLNVALYTNITVDDLLEDARTTRDEAEHAQAIRDFEDEVASETPAIFLYSPSFTYVVRSDISTTPMQRIVRPNERFSNISAWHISESNVWSIFTD